MLAELPTRRRTRLVRRLDAANIGLRKGRLRHPLGRVARRGLLQHTINLLQAQAFGFRHEEVRKEHAGRAG